MIPKKIHYCWFGRGEKPKLAQMCIASWRKYCPDYEIVEWNEDNFDLDYNAYTRQLVEAGLGVRMCLPVEGGGASTPVKEAQLQPCLLHWRGSG